MRSARKRNLKYNDDDSDLDDLLAPMMMSPSSSKKSKKVVEEEEPPLVIEKVLGRKFIRENENGEEEEDDDADPRISEMYLIKWRGLSYIHVSWELRSDIENVDPQGKVKLKRFLLGAHPPQIFGDPSKVENEDDPAEEEEDIEYFNPEYAEVHRIISCDMPDCIHSTCESVADLNATADVPDDSELDMMYYVKWRGLPYNECSWETWADLKYYTSEVFAFWSRQRPRDLSSLNVKHPSLQEYSRLLDSPVYGAPSTSSSDGDKEELEGQTGLRMRDYQLEGVNWLLWNWWHKRPCILADEMGLGKTIQSVCFLHQLRTMSTTKCSGPFLVVAPLSLISQWQSEISLWSPDINCVVMHGSQQSRDIILDYEFYYHESFTPKADVAALRKQNACKFDILLTTYEVCMKDIKLFTKINWKVLIVDEAHRLKNNQSRLFEMMMTIPRQQCVLLTGTPLQNKTEELWALLHFSDPTKFKNQDDFVEKFGDLRDAADVAKLHSMLKPYLLRRVKEDVEKTLPPKEEVIVEVTLTSFQKQFYRAIYEKNVQFLFRGAKASNTPSLMNVMMELRKCCNHPYLIRGVEDRLVAEMRPEERTERALHQKLVDCSGKFVLLDKLLPRLKDEGRKVLIFSQMVKVLNLLEDYLRGKEYLFERLDGSTRSMDRNIAVERFCRPSQKRLIMLLSTKAGGLGLNLTAADTVIIFDSDWNPHNDMQAQARAHRIGQTKAVKVYRLLTRKTYEMHMFHRASLKLGLDKAVLAHARNEQEAGEDKVGEEAGKLDLQAKEIDELLKRGAYDVFRDDDTEQTEFVEADIDSILSRQAHVVSMSNATDNSLSSSLGGFSKASFVSADEKEDIDINDPDFWKKAVGFDEPILEEDVDPFIENLPDQRIRKQTQVFGENDANERELEELLRVQPIKKSPDKSAAKEAKENRERERKEKKERKEQEKREKKERREKEKREKAVPVPKKKKEKPPKEPKEHKDSKSWGPHARDRMLRALLQYGFGRWKKIRTESGASHRELKDIESFTRSYMLQCGICAGVEEKEGERKRGSVESKDRNKNSQFVEDAINAAKQIQELVEKGEVEMETLIPSILQDSKFLVKLKGGSKKMLNKLDYLTKLFSMMGEAVSAYRAEHKPEIEDNGDLDYIIAQIDDSKVLSQYLPFGDVRPSWTRPRSWWNDECDRHLVMGVFEHGHGRYTEIRDDANFIFQSKMKEAAKHAKGLLDSESKGKDVIVKLADQILGMTTNVRNKYKDVVNDDVVVTELPISAEIKCRIQIATTRYSQFRGVYSQPGSTKWMAQYGNNSISTFIGSFDSELEAAVAYDALAKKLEGSDAGCNFISSDEPDWKPIRQTSVLPFARDESPPLPWHRASRYRGVRASGAKWTAQICYEGVNHHLGTFSGEYQASISYDLSAKNHHKDVAVYNFPDGIKGELDTLKGMEGVEISYFDVLTGKTMSDEEVDAATAAAAAMKVKIESKSEEEKTADEKNDEDKDEATPMDIDSHNMEQTLETALKTEDPIIVHKNDSGSDTQQPKLPQSPPKNENDDICNDFASYTFPQHVMESSLVNDQEVKVEVDELNVSADIEDDNDDDNDDDEEDDDDDKDRKVKKDAGESLLSAAEERIRVDMLMPESRVLNRLFVWLVTSEEARQLKSDNDMIVGSCDGDKCAPKGPQKKRKRGGRKSKDTDDMDVDMEDTEVVVPEKISKRSLNKASTPSVSKTSRSGPKPVGDTLDESDVLAMHHDIFDNGSYNFPQKLSLLGKYEAVLSEPPHHHQDTAEVNKATISPGDDGDNRVSVTESSRSIGDEDAKRLCAAFVLFGAPMEDQNEAVLSSDISALLGTSIQPAIKRSDNDEIGPVVGRMGEHLATLQWESLTTLAGVDIQAKKVHAFYDEMWLPFCVNIASVNSFTNKVLLPEPNVDSSSHYPSTKNLCSLFMQRQRMLYAMKYVLSRFPYGIKTFLHQHAGTYTIGMPVWWCPWIHDIALMVGCLKHGFLNMDKICLDDELPFSESNLERHIYRVFIYGTSTHAPAAVDLFSSVEEAREWVAAVSMIFPSKRDLEGRMTQILSEVTRHLPSRHLCRIYNAQESIHIQDSELSTAADRSTGAEVPEKSDVLSKVHKCAPSTGHSAAAFDSANGFTEWGIRLPLTPLTVFAQDSARRRRLSLTHLLQKSSAPSQPVPPKKKYKKKADNKSNAKAKKSKQS